MKTNTAAKEYEALLERKMKYCEFVSNRFSILQIDAVFLDNVLGSQNLFDIPFPNALSVALDGLDQPEMQLGCEINDKTWIDILSAIDTCLVRSRERHNIYPEKITSRQVDGKEKLFVSLGS
jgi:hypothetical protein